MSTKKKQFSMNLRDMENFFKYRRMPYPKRSAEFIALIAVSCTLFLFLHTKTLNSRLHEMEIKLQPSELSAIGLSASNSIQSGSDSKSDMKGVHGTYQYLKSTGQSYQTVELNNTKKARMDIVFFNRVPKTGSQALMQLMKELVPRNNIRTARDKAQKYETVVLGPLHQINVAEEVAEQKEPTFYSKHVAYINFTRYELPKPIYVNLVRDPIERIISWYNYIRAPWYYQQLQAIFKDVQIPDKEWMEKDFDTCVREKNKLCIFEQDIVNDGSSDHRRQSLFFCGHNRAECMPFNSRAVLQKAKRIVEEEYAVVGTWEEANVTLTVLENYIPMFFKGITDIYYTKKTKYDNVNKNSVKKPVSEEVKEMLRTNLTNEIEFYEFCKRRLYQQYNALKLN